jgi:signal transduction histidine kinase/CheY-like chemotaxis protein
MNDENKTREQLMDELHAMRRRVDELETVCREIGGQEGHEVQLRNDRKMEPIRQIAGDVAHDFNNILTSIIGYASILKAEADDRLTGYIDQIVHSVEKAAQLTQGLLTFSRKQIIRSRPTDLKELVTGMEKILSKIAGDDITVRTIVTDQDLTILADSTQIEQVLMNLVANARDAMPYGGKLSITTARTELDEAYRKTYGYGEPGKYALISFVDTGIGMDEATRERIFDPFFSARGGGKGSGLGLSIVYGIIKQHGGYINVTSQPGEGTTFKVYLPLMPSATEKTEIPKTSLPQAAGTILLAEDDTEVRNLIKWVLEEFGYQVIEAADGAESIRKFIEHIDQIHLLLLDIVMPKKNGAEVYEEIKKIKPDIKALFLSGYTEDVLSKEGVLGEGMHFIGKPISPRNLLKKINEVLESKS